MNLKNIRELHRVIFQKIGIQNVDKKPYEVCTEEVLRLLLDAHKRINDFDRERLRNDLDEIQTIRQN